jgi:hypothetical protein
VIGQTDEWEVVTPSFLPDGRRFLYTALPSSPSRAAEVCFGSLEVKEASCLEGIDPPAVYSSAGYLLFLRDGALLAQSFDAERLQTSGEARRIQDVQIVVNQQYEPPLFSASRNGVLVFHGGALGNQLVWHSRDGTHLGSPVGPGERPALSRDGRWLAVQRRDGQRTPTICGFTIFRRVRIHGSRLRPATTLGQLFHRMVRLSCPLQFDQAKVPDTCFRSG